MNAHDWMALASMVGGAIVVIVTVAWYLATRLSKQDAKIAVIEAVTHVTREDVAYLRQAKEEERRANRRVRVRDHGFGVIDGGNGNGRHEDD